MTGPHEVPSDMVERELLHRRSIDFQGFRRGDGLFEVEARLLDTKPNDFQPPSGAPLVPAHRPIHDLGLRVVFDEAMVIRAVHTTADAFPYPDCVDGGLTLQAMVGVTIGAGWNRNIRERLPRGDTCTHLRELLIPLASAAFQTLYTMKTDVSMDRDEDGRPRKIDSCYAYGASRSIVKTQWPHYYRPVSDPE